MQGFGKRAFWKMASPFDRERGEDAARLAEFQVAPQPDDDRLSQAVQGIDQTGQAIDLRVVTERPLTLFLNKQEIVTLMTIGDYPELLAVGYLLNQGMLASARDVVAVEHDEELETVVVRTSAPTNF